MSDDDRPCAHCGGGPLFIKKGVQSGTPLGPNLLPELSFPSATLDVVVCESCGYVQFFVNRFHRKNLSKSWKPVARKAKPS